MKTAVATPALMSFTADCDEGKNFVCPCHNSLKLREKYKDVGNDSK